MRNKILFLTILIIIILPITCLAINYGNQYTFPNSVDSILPDYMLNSILEIMLFIYAIILVLAFIRIIALCFIFDLANEPWWKALIPIYNLVVSFKIVELSPWLLLSFLIMLIPSIGVQILGYMVIIIIGIVFSIKLAQAFGKSIAFMFGLIFLPTVFYCILAFGNSEYKLINNQNELFNTNTNENIDEDRNEAENRKDKRKNKKNKYIVVDPETGEEIDPKLYEPMDLSDYKPKSDFFK